MMMRYVPQHFFSGLRIDCLSVWSLLLCLIVSPLSFSGGLDQTTLGASSETSAFPSVAKAFQAQWSYDGEEIIGEFTIAPGCYLYRDRFKLVLHSPKETFIESLDLPAGEQLEDPFLGGQHEIYRKHLTVRAKVHQRTPEHPLNKNLEVEVTWQGCAEAGLCYPPVHKTLHLSKTLP